MYLNGVAFKHLPEGIPVNMNEDVLPYTDNGLTIGDPSWPQSLKVMNLRIENSIALPTQLFHDYFEGK